MLDQQSIELCRAYAEARCGARAAYDRQQRAAARQSVRFAQLAYAKGDRASRPYLREASARTQPANSLMVSLRLGDGLGMQIFAPFGFWEFVWIMP